jgi:hypothetical protein
MINFMFSGFSPVHYAAYYGQDTALELLLQTTVRHMFQIRQGAIRGQGGPNPVPPKLDETGFKELAIIHVSKDEGPKSSK